jgi:hypothetical protein
MKKRKMDTNSDEEQYQYSDQEDYEYQSDEAMGSGEDYQYSSGF